MRKNAPSYSLQARLVSGFFCVVLVMLVNTTTHSQQLKKGMMPVSPDLLFRALPKNVEGWKLKQSKGQLGIGIWVESEVLREFERVPRENDEKQEKPASTKITIKDTAKTKGGELDFFTDFKPGKFPAEGYEDLYLGGVPAILIKHENKELEAQFLIKDRFVLIIVMRDQLSRNLKTWFDKIKLSTLLAIPDEPKTYLPNDFTVIEIDELNPSKSRRYRSNASSAETAGEDNKAASSEANTDE